MRGMAPHGRDVADAGRGRYPRGGELPGDRPKDALAGLWPPPADARRGRSRGVPGASSAGGTGRLDRAAVVDNQVCGRDGAKLSVAVVAKRVDLVVRAMALRRGLAVGPREVTQEDIDLSA